MQLETVRCALCGSDRSKVLMMVKDNRHHTPGTFGLVECLGCRLRFINPRPTRESIHEAYPQDYIAHWRFAERQSTWKSPFAWAWDRYQSFFLGESYPVFFYRKHLKDFSVGGRKPRILDVGCGSGMKLLYLKRHGWDTWGVDFSETAIEHAMANGIDHGTATFADVLPHPDGFFEALMSWHSLEHHFDPLASLKEMRRVLKPGGYGIVAVPTGDNLGLRLFKQNWGPLEPPRHLYHFTRETLTQMMEKAGLEVTAHHYDYTYYGLFLDEELLGSLEYKAREMGLPLRFPRPRGYSILARIPLLPFSESLGKLWKGMNLVIHFRRPLHD